MKFIYFMVGRNISFDNKIKKIMTSQQTKFRQDYGNSLSIVRHKISEFKTFTREDSYKKIEEKTTLPINVTGG